MQVSTPSEPPLTDSQAKLSCRVCQVLHINCQTAVVLLACKLWRETPMVVQARC